MLFTTAFLASFATTLVATPIVRWLAKRYDVLDRPDRRRKLHVQATPLGGGVAVLLGFLVSLGVVFSLSHSQHREFVTNTRFVASLLAAACFIVAVGLFDDRFGLRGRQKLAAQFLAAFILMGGGLWIGGIELFGEKIELGLLAFPFTLFWILGAVNALNLIDGMDGLASSVGLVLSVSVAGMAALTGHPTEAFMALALGGGLLAFLLFNRPPASIFLWDAGSMLVGLVLGALAIRASLKGPTTVTLIAPTAVWAIPIFDVAMAILRRRLTGRSIYETDRNHMHHRLQNRGFSRSGTVVVIGTFCGITALAAVISVYVRNELLALGTVLGLLLVLVLFRVFGHQELNLLLQRTRNLGRSLIPNRHGHRPPAEPTYARMQGSREWNDLWQTLIAFAERFDVAAIQMSLTMPMINEEFHADWTRKNRPAESDLWHSDIPLRVNDLAVGRLRLTGTYREGSVCMWMGDLIAGLQPFETQLLDMLSDHLSDEHPRTEQPEPVSHSS